MTLAKLNTIAQTLGVVALVVSLVFAGVVETYKRWLVEPGFRRIALDFSAFIDSLLPPEPPRS